jgi:NhaA family Na+:H+ antiporter
LEQNSGLVLLAATVLALAWANSPWQSSYFALLGTRLSVDLGLFALSKDLQHWINDGLMTVFFFVVGLEIKREIVHGELGSARRAALPIAAALGGMVFPALIYFALNREGEAVRGWGVPMATDIAFALGVLALLGKRAPTELRIFLLTLAVVDDIGAILVIAVFYTEQLSVTALAVAVLLLGVIVLANRVGLRETLAYLVLGILVWLAVLQSGVHATIAGVVLGILTPAQPFLRPEAFGEKIEDIVRTIRSAIAQRDHESAESALGELEQLTVSTEAPVERLERLAHPWSSYLVLPIFAFANAGVSLSGEALSAAAISNVTLGIALGLLIGKPLGILLLAWLAVRLGLAVLPATIAWRQVLGVGLLAGIGFTVALFIGDLAFADQSLKDAAKIGIFGASLLAGIVGYVFLRVQGNVAVRKS